jgi:hypothetical protein
MEEMLVRYNEEEYELLAVIEKTTCFKRKTVVHGGEFIHSNQNLCGASVDQCPRNTTEMEKSPTSRLGNHS